MGTVVLDSSVVLGMLDTEDALHKPAADVIGQSIEEGAEFRLPATVLAEVLAGEARRARSAVDKRREQLVSLFGAPRVVDEDVAVEAARLRARRASLRLPDALVIATGVVDDVTTILTGDRRWSGIDGRIRILRH